MSGECALFSFAVYIVQRHVLPSATLCHLVPSIHPPASSRPMVWGSAQGLRISFVVQEVSVRGAKGVSAALTIAGTAMVFTPLMPVGLGLLLTGAGVGVTTTGGNLVGERIQMDVLQAEVAKLNTAEVAVQQALGKLVRHFPLSKNEDWEAVQSAGVSFKHANSIVPVSSLNGVSNVLVGGNAVRLASGAVAHFASAALSIVGVVVSTGDFVYSLLNDSPNRKSVQEMCDFLQAHKWRCGTETITIS